MSSNGEILDKYDPTEMSAADWMNLLLQRLIADEGQSVVVARTEIPATSEEQFIVLHIHLANVLTPEQFDEFTQGVLDGLDEDEEPDNPVLG